MASMSTALILAASRSAAGVTLPVRVASREAGFQGLEAGPEKSLADVDVAEAGDDALVHEEGLEVGLPPQRAPGQIGAVEIVAQRLDAEAGEEGILGEIALRDQRHVAEAAGVVVGDDGAAGHGEDQVVVLSVIAVLVDVLAERQVPLAAAVGDGQPPGHAEVHGQHLVPIEMDQDVLGAPAEAQHAPAGQALGEALRQGEAQVGAPLLHPHERAPGEHGLQARAHRLDLGQLRHGCLRPPCRP